MKYTKTVAWLMVSVWFGIGAVAAAAEGRVGVVDFQRVLDESVAGKAAQAEINKRGKEMETALKSKGDELEAMRSQLQRDAMVMTGEMREEKEREFRIKVNDLKEMQKDYAKTAREMQIRAMARIRNEVDEVARAIGEKEGFALIIEKQEAGVLFAVPAIDLTAKVIQRYDAQPPKAK
jgi:outer membrane protein